MNNKHHENIIIGAGQAGLAMAFQFHKNNNDYIILERDKVASTWENQYDSLTLITPDPFLSLDGKKFETSEKFPTKDQVVNYLREYASAFKEHIKLGVTVAQISKEEDDSVYKLITNQGVFTANNVIVATGYNGKPFTPKLATDLHHNVIQLHASEYKSLASLPKEKKTIAVIGSGNSGIAIAKELSQVHDVALFEGNVKRFPRKILGIDIFFWVSTIGLFKIKTGTFLGDRLAKKLIPKGDPTYGYYPKKIAKEYGFKLFDRLIKCKKNILTDTKSNSIEVDGVIWATGYKTNYHEFIKLNIFDENNQVQHFRGVTAYDGLYFMGLKWQSNISSFLIFGVKDDAKFLYKQMQSNKKTTKKYISKILTVAPIEA